MLNFTFFSLVCCINVEGSGLRNRCILVVEHWEMFLFSGRHIGLVEVFLLAWLLRWIILFLALIWEENMGIFFPSLCPFYALIKLLLLSPVLTAGCKPSFCVAILSILCWIILENCFPETAKASGGSAGPSLCRIASGMWSNLDISAPLHRPFAAVWLGFALPLM